MSASASSVLHDLAEHVGIIAEYRDQTGKETRRTSDETRRAVLAAMGIDASSDGAARDALGTIREEETRELIAPARVVREARAAAHHLRVRAPSSRTSSGPWRLEIETEDGDRHVTEGPWRGDTRLDLVLPELPLGYHRLCLSMSAGGNEWVNEQTLIVAPERCVGPGQILGEGKAFGLTANLYSVRSNANWGIGDFSDLGAVARWGGSVGADFVGVNPLHALINRGEMVSPYSPVTRLFRNPVYIDVARVPELQHAPEIRDRIASEEMRAELDALRGSQRVRYEQVSAVKGLVLDALHEVFMARVRESGDTRAQAYRRFIRDNEPQLTRFAIWMAIADREGSDWREWPEELRHSDGPAVYRFAQEHASRVDYHRWLQFEADRQLGEAAEAARGAGMRIGLYQDLAIGTAPSGADTWSFRDLFVTGAAIGAPPDPYSASGQNWGLPPIDPRALRRDSYRYFIDLVRSGFRHAGALRIDHVMGLFRLFWIPEGKTGADGAYVRYPSEDLLGIVALESVRNNAMVVGEDLGTVPPDVPPALERWGVMSSKVLYFERDEDGAFNAASSYAPLALATANTHDMPTIAGFWEGRDVELRLQVGLLSENDAAGERDKREKDREQLLQRLAAEKVIAEPTAPRGNAALRGAVHGFLGRTPSHLVGLSLDDIAGETEPVNVPGVGPDKYPSWTRKMRDSLDSLVISPETQAALRCDGRRSH